jgi:hypothetical protein
MSKKSNKICKKLQKTLVDIKRKLKNTIKNTIVFYNKQKAARFPIMKKRSFRLGVIGSFFVFVASIIIFVIIPLVTPPTYSLGTAGSLLSPVSDVMAKKLTFDVLKSQFNFVSGQDQSNSIATTTNTQKIAATINQDPSKGMTVTDSTNSVALSSTPKFGLAGGEQSDNRIVFPLTNKKGWLVYTLQGTGVKEDILLTKSDSDTQDFNYKFEFGDGLEARLESDGGIGVYGNTLLSGNVTTSTDDDAALLQKARQKAEKNTLLFVIPKPYIVEKDGKTSSAKAVYELKDDNLTIKVSGLSKANYPLTIDPSIYVVTAQQFMNGNNETNIDFDVANKLIKKSPTTGARFDEWNTTTSLPTKLWSGGTVAAGGYIYSVGGISFNGQIYNTQGADNFVVPSGVTSITVRMWSGGGGGGAGGSGGVGGAGGGSGYVSADLAVTPGETLSIYVGGGGAQGVRNTAGGGGAGGGFSSIYRGSTLLALVAGGGGGGGGLNSAARLGGAGGAGGGLNGIAGSPGGVAGGGGYGSQSAGGAGGTGGSNSGSPGSSLNGGDGGDGRTSQGTDGTGAIGGLATGGNGGRAVVTNRAGAGGGGAGYYGGGGGSGSSSSSGAGGGGGGSSYTIPSATSVTNTAGSGTAPGNASDIYRNGAGDGGAGGAVYGAGTAGDNGIVFVTYSGGSSATQSVSWAQFNTSTGTIDSANPGSGTCSGWCTTAAYNLPSARSNYSLVAYNGFLYAMGGLDSSGTRQNTVYIAKIGANGEPQLWHPTNTDKSTWVYWYTDTALNSIRSDMSAVAYNNRMYLMGGRSTSGTPVSTVEIADITPTGKLGTWTASTSLPSNLYGHGSQVYNDRLYVLGGAATVGGAPVNSVYYTKIDSDGTLNNWIQTTSFTTGRISGGGNLSAVWGAYIYISGGCSAVNASGYCTTVSSDTQLASINADGSLDVWNTVGGVSSQRMGSGIVSWRNKIYNVGGCSAQNTTAGDCNSSTLDSIVYGDINQDGDASTVAQSVASGTAPCSGTTPTNCNLPGTSYIGNLLNETIITNGYLYVIGGCVNDGCNTTDGDTAYVAISSTGEMTKPATCPYGAYQGGAWCVDDTHSIAGGIAGSSPVIFGGRLYLVGGFGGAGNKGNCYYTTLNNDGSISGWTLQTMASLGAVSVSYTFAYTRANPSSASTIPGNLYIFGGCTVTSGAGCSGYTDDVYKCNILASGALSGCTTSGQLQIGIVPGDTQPGLAIHSGTSYANYIYLIGGVTPNLVDMATVRYAKFDDNNNVVAVSGSAWIESPNEMAVGRRRASSFGYNGYIYVVGGYDATEGVLPDIEFIEVNVSDGSLGDAETGFIVSAVTINQRWGLSVPVSNSYAYVIGGCTSGSAPSGCTARTDIIQTFQVYNNDSGSPAGYSTSANTYGTNPNRIGASSTILDGYIYVAGGCTSATDCTTAINTVSYAPIDVNGALGTWSNTTGTWPSGAVRTWGKLEAAGGTLYYIGGQSSTATDRRTEVYYGTPSSGNVSTWTAASNGLPAARTKFGSTVWNDRLYVVGGEGTGTGCTASNVCNTVYVSPQLNSGGNITSAWSTTSTSFDTARSGATAIAYANNLYIFGGYDGTNYLSDTQYSQISASTGLAGSWTFSTSLPMPLSQAEGFAANGYIYLTGGRSSATTCDPITIVSPVSANTTISTGNNPTGIGEWYETNQRYTGSRYGAAAAYYDGKAYVLGGGCGATLTYASPVTQQTALLSQPQVAKYSIMIDTDSDVFPNNWLLNGVDNSIGAYWQLKYRSMTNTTTSCTTPAMTTWGSDTNFGNVTLGLPGIYTPKDGSGTDTNCARFYYFNVTVDSSEAFGYPDDVSRGPTITDLTLQFSADPSKRLMHGRTFIGGLQQPDDTPYYSY